MNNRIRAAERFKTSLFVFKIVIAIWAIIPAVLLHGNHLTIFRIDVLHNTQITGWKRKIIIYIVYTENFSPLDGHAKQKGSQIPFYHLQGHRTQVNKVGCVSLLTMILTTFFLHD